MKNLLMSPVASNVIAAIGGALVVAAIHKQTMDSPRTLVLPKQAYDMLVNDETNFIRFENPNHNHAFRVTLEPFRVPLES